MLISLQWLSAWVDLDDLSTNQIIETLSVSGLEVASVSEIGPSIDPLNKIVVGKIESIEPHPKAERLVICTVHAGGDAPRTIVCGAKNMVEGDVVPVALPGSQPPGIDFEIVERKVMGVVSSGMLCAQEELALAESSDGLWILPKELEASIGQPIFEALNIRDTLLEIEVTPNRPDALSHRGVARDLAALFGRKLRTLEERLERLPRAYPSEMLPEDAEKPSISKGCDLSVDLKTSLSLHYALLGIDHVSVRPSPEWLQILLQKVELRPVNNVVDLTNFIMFDIGQPLHAFDRDVVGAGVVLCEAKDCHSKQLKAINHKEYTLSEEDLIIASHDLTPHAIAGVMGGATSEVSEKTHNLLLECAFFDPTSVRKTSKRLAIHTDASHRYERGMDKCAIPTHLAYAAQVFGKVLQFNVLPETVSQESVVTHNLDNLQPRTIEFPCSEYKRYIGESIETSRAIEIFNALELTTVVSTQPDTLTVTIPGFRPDLERPVDLVEELVRIIGMNTVTPSSTFQLNGGFYEERTNIPDNVEKTLVPRRVSQWLRELRTQLLTFGFYEHVAYSFMTTEDLDFMELSDDDRRRTQAVGLLNQPTFMRTSMFPSMLAAAKLNVARRHSDLPLFEIGRTYFADTKKEHLNLSLFAMGHRSEHFKNKNELWDFYDVKGILEDLFAYYGLHLDFQVPEKLEPYLHPGVQADIFVKRECLYDSSEECCKELVKVGHIGRLHPKLTQELEDPAFFAELELSLLLPDFHNIPQAKTASKYQPVARDFAFLVPKSLTWKALKDSIYRAAKKDLKLATDLRSCHVFDVFEGEQVKEGFRSIAIALLYQSNESTLAESEISAYDSIILDAVKNDFGLTLRS